MMDHPATRRYVAPSGCFCSFAYLRRLRWIYFALGVIAGAVVVSLFN
jgi:hypothetical protein